jgi:hypothetical protein
MIHVNVMRRSVVSWKARTVAIEIYKQRKMLGVQKRDCFRQNRMVLKMQQKNFHRDIFNGFGDCAK